MGFPVNFVATKPISIGQVFGRAEPEGARKGLFQPIFLPSVRTWSGLQAIFGSRVFSSLSAACVFVIFGMMQTHCISLLRLVWNYHSHNAHEVGRSKQMTRSGPPCPSCSHRPPPRSRPCVGARAEPAQKGAELSPFLAPFEGRKKLTWNRCFPPKLYHTFRIGDGST